MKLDKEQQEFLYEVTKLAKNCKVSSFIIDIDGFRGLADDRSVVLIMSTFDTDMPFEGMATQSAIQLYQQMTIHLGNDPKSIELELDDDDNVKELRMASKRLNIDHRCVKPARVIAKKKLNDVPYCNFDVSDDSYDLLKRSATSLKSDIILFSKMEEEDFIAMKVSDESGTKIVIEVDSSEINFTDAECFFSNRYSLKTMLHVMNIAAEKKLYIGEGGSLMLKISGVDVIIPPHVEE